MNETLTYSQSVLKNNIKPSRANISLAHKVLVCKTSVQLREHALLLTEALDELVGKGMWNFALDDCDRILRIKAGRDYLNQVIALLNRHGFCCSELED